MEAGSAPRRGIIVLRSVVKDAAAQALSWTGLDAVARASLRRSVPYVVAYHRVVERLGDHDGFALPAMEISVAMLEKHLDWLGRYFEIVSPDDLVAKTCRERNPLLRVSGRDVHANVVRVDAAGYRLAFTICRHRDAQHPMLTIARKGLWERSSLDRRGRFSRAIMSCQAAGTFDRFAPCSAPH